MKIISRAEAKELGLTRYYTGRPCGRGHIVERYTSKGECVKCKLLWYKRHPDVYRANTVRYRTRHGDLIRERHQEWVSSNRDLNRQHKHNWVNANRERHYRTCKRYRDENPEKRRATEIRYAAENRDKVNARAARRRARFLKAHPPWLTDEHKQQILDKYSEAAVCSQLTGVEHHVDHIEPLQGRDRCGWHVPWNLQILTGSENVAKGNRPLAA